MTVHIREIVENFPDSVTLVRGSNAAAINDLQAASSASQHSLIFVTNRQHLQEAKTSAAQTWIVQKQLLGEVPESVPTVLTASNVQLAMAQIAARFFRPSEHFQPVGQDRIHPKAVIGATAKVGEGCIIGPGAVIGEHCVIGDRAVIGANAVIETRAKIGARTHIHPLVYIGHDCEVGQDCEIQPNTTVGTEGFGYAQDPAFNHYRITHFGRVIIEDCVHIGSGVNIDRGTYLDSRIGAGTRIDNHCHFGHNIQIGKNSLITAGMITAGSTTIGSYCVFGGRTTIAGHLSITDKSQFAGISGITKSVNQPGEYGGLPLQSLKDSLRTRSATTKLPALIKQVKMIMNHLGLKYDDKGED